VTPAEVTRIAEGLIRAGEALRTRSSVEIAETLGRVGERFLDERDPLRTEALQGLPTAAGLSPEMARATLDGMARDWTRPRLKRLLEIEFGDPSSLDGLVDGPDRTEMAIGPKLCAQFVAGGVPGVSVSALIRGLLVKGPTFVKPGRGDETLPTLFERALRQEDAEVADALAVEYWPGGSTLLDDALLAAPDVVTAYGSDETVQALRARSPATTRFVGYRHRVSIGVVGRSALSAESAASTAAAIAAAVGMFDQRGCVCPQAVYVEEGGEVSPSEFARELARASVDFEIEFPSGHLDAEEAAAVHQLRGTAELHEGVGAGHVDHGGSTGTWTVLYEPEAMEGPSGLSRAIRVRPIDSAEQLAEVLRPIGAQLQTVGVAGLDDRLHALAQAWGRLGASRIVPFGEVSFPPPWWLHDGKGPLRELVRWVEVRGD
jgi:hypothetical protein